MKDFTTNNIVVETTPGASLFWKGGELDGGYINTANDKGIAIIWLSKYAYKKNEQKRIIIAKEKFKP